MRFKARVYTGVKATQYAEVRTAMPRDLPGKDQFLTDLRQVIENTYPSATDFSPDASTYTLGWTFTADVLVSRFTGRAKALKGIQAYYVSNGQIRVNYPYPGEGNWYMAVHKRVKPDQFPTRRQLESALTKKSPLVYNKFENPRSKSNDVHKFEYAPYPPKKATPKS
jgi:hypothetical protein